MFSAMTFCVRLSLNMVSPLCSATCTTVSTSKVMARSKSSLACSIAATYICGKMAAIFWSATISAISYISRRCSSLCPPWPSYRPLIKLPSLFIYSLNISIFPPTVFRWRVVLVSDKAPIKIQPPPDHIVPRTESPGFYRLADRIQKHQNPNSLQFANFEWFYYRTPHFWHFSVSAIF